MVGDRSSRPLGLQASQRAARARAGRNGAPQSVQVFRRGTEAKWYALVAPSRSGTTRAAPEQLTCRVPGSGTAEIQRRGSALEQARPLGRAARRRASDGSSCGAAGLERRRTTASLGAAPHSRSGRRGASLAVAEHPARARHLGRRTERHDRQADRTAGRVERAVERVRISSVRGQARSVLRAAAAGLGAVRTPRQAAPPARRERGDQGANRTVPTVRSQVLPRRREPRLRAGAMGAACSTVADRSLPVKTWLAPTGDLRQKRRRSCRRS